MIPMTLMNGMWCALPDMLIFTIMRPCAQTLNKPNLLLEGVGSEMVRIDEFTLVH